jgi:hypothetical protein
LSKGKMMVRDRIDALLDPGTAFLELSPLAGHDMYRKKGSCIFISTSFSLSLYFGAAALVGAGEGQAYWRYVAATETHPRTSAIRSSPRARDLGRMLILSTQRFNFPTHPPTHPTHPTHLLYHPTTSLGMAQTGRSRRVRS